MVRPCGFFQSLNTSHLSLHEGWRSFESYLRNDKASHSPGQRKLLRFEEPIRHPPTLISTIPLNFWVSLFTCKPLKFPPKMALFARNRKSIFPLHRETLVSEIPVRLSPYTVLLNYFLHTINFIHTFPPNVLITHSPPYIPALLMVWPCGFFQS